MKHDFDDADLLDLQAMLREVGRLTDIDRADAAAARSIAFVSDQASHPKPPYGGPPYRRWLMRLGIAAVIAIGIAVAFQLSATRPVAAAELLRQATEKQEKVDRWITLRTFADASDTKGNAWAVQPKAGFYLYGDPAKPADGFEMIDTIAKQRARYEPELKLLILVDFNGEDPRNTQMPLSLDELLKWPQLADYDSQQSESADLRTLTFTRHSAAAIDASAPLKLIVTIDIKTGLLRTGSVQMKVGEALRPFFEFVQSSTIAFTTLDELPVPEGSKKLDLRVAPAVRGTIEAMENVRRDGVGLDGAMIVTTYTRATDGTAGEFGRIQLFVERDGAGFYGSWRVGAAMSMQDPHVANFPVGWPKPTFEAAMEAVKGHPCEQFTVVNGSERAWALDQDPAKGWPNMTRVEPIPAGRASLIAESIYPEIGYSNYTGYRKSELSESPINKRPLITVTDLGRWTNHPTELRPTRIRRCMISDVGTNVIPTPVLFEDMRLDEEGRASFSHMRTDFDLGNPARWGGSDHRAFIPTKWRLLPLKADDGDAYTAYCTFIPVPGAKVPAEWLKLPPPALRRP